MSVQAIALPVVTPLRGSFGGCDNATSAPFIRIWNAFRHAASLLNGQHILNLAVGWHPFLSRLFFNHLKH